VDFDARPPDRRTSVLIRHNWVIYSETLLPHIGEAVYSWVLVMSIKINGLAFIVHAEANIPLARECY